MAALSAGRRLVGCAVVAMTALGGGVARAEPGSAVTLEVAVQRAIAGNPALAVGREDLSVTEARLGRAGLRPAAEIGLELENFAGSGEFSGVDELETTLQLSRVLERGDKRERRMAVARAEQDAARLDFEAARITVATDAASRFMGVLGTQEQLGVARRFLVLAEGIRAEARRRVAAGRALSAEVYRADAVVGREQLMVARARGELDMAGRDLAAAWGQTDAPPGPAVGDLFATPPLEPLAQILARLEATPQLARLAAGRQVREAERRLAAAEARADFAWSVGARHLNGPGDIGLVAGLSIPFGATSRSRPLVAEANALVRRAEAEQAATRVDVSRTVAALHRQVELRRETLAVLQRDVLPATAAALEQIDRGYRLGRLAYGEYAQAAREALDAELEKVQVATEYHQYLVELEGLTRIAIATEDRP